MNKGELVDQVNEATKGNRSDYLTKADVEQVVNATLDAVEKGLNADKEVRLPGFGTFKVTAKPERQGTNPATGEKMTIAAKNAVSFKPGANLKDAVN